jgi:hypothetical protein
MVLWITLFFLPSSTCLVGFPVPLYWSVAKLKWPNTCPTKFLIWLSFEEISRVYSTNDSVTFFRYNCPIHATFSWLCYNMVTGKDSTRNLLDLFVFEYFISEKKKILDLYITKMDVLCCLRVVLISLYSLKSLCVQIYSLLPQKALTFTVWGTKSVTEFLDYVAISDRV